MASFTMGISLPGRCMGRACAPTQMEASTKVILKRMRGVGMGSWKVLMDRFMKENGERIRDMGKELHISWAMSPSFSKELG